MNPPGYLDSGDIRRLKRSLDITAFYQFPASFGVLPPGGLTGEVLAKLSNADGDVGWEVVAGGGSPNLDGGTADSNYGGIAMISGGGA